MCLQQRWQKQRRILLLKQYVSNDDQSLMQDFQARGSLLPENRFFYRGLSDMNLPDHFFQKDEYGVRGGTELWMMSISVLTTFFQ